LDNLL